MPDIAKTPTNLFFPLYQGTAKFNSNSHFHSFLKYLFSCSVSHTQNDNTSYNSYIQRDIMQPTFVVNGKSEYNTFKNKYWNDISDETQFENALHYIFFIIKVDNRLITNLLEFNEDHNLTVCIDENMFESLLEEYFEGEETHFFECVDAVINKVDIDLVNFSEATLEERKTIEYKIHKAIQQNTDKNILISMSHHDQDSSYHIHQVLQHN